ncbi:MAG: hypothetical protein IPK82_19950 [Polyangiaceae bacterium]|nr:hypothetical protein [Polyangiaceae bacterium]
MKRKELSMVELRSWAVRAFALPSVVLLGLINTGCPGNNSTTSGPGGDGGTAGTTSNGGGGSGGSGGTGGATCTPMTEICDMKDNDCDGTVDNIAGGAPCTCNDGDTQNCYSGPEGTLNVGVCVQGNQTCQGGQWGACTGEVIPSAEACNLQDDDCNGAADDMGQATCGVGACAVTVEKCLNGQEQACVPNQPTLEICDGVDNNCNQLIDESDPMLNSACMTGSPGVCSQGKMTCTAGVLACTADIMPTPETCDGLDTDCDGTVDNNIPGTGGDCSTGQLGVCAAGTITCQLSGGTYQVDCFPNTAASAEACDGLDNDCDGQPDDGNPEGGGACNTGQLGVCGPGTLNCLNGAIQCTPNALAQPEVCDGIDNNCDGQADEGNPGGNQACGCAGAGMTACQNGQVVCNGGPITYFSDDFSANNKGWTLDQTWQIGPAAASTGCGFGNDPATDHTSTADNGVAGVNIGGCYPTTTHPDYCMTSPNIDTSQAPQVFLNYWRHLHCDYPGFMTHTVGVSSNGGASWTNVYAVPSGVQQNDINWTSANFNITAYKSSTMRIRFCYAGTSSGIISGGGWNIDDVTVASATCP